LVSDYFGLINYMLPEPGSNERASGKESKSDETPAWSEAINEKNARENNEV
jgi:hypothetical protein